jgi:hypothetical protein
MKAETINRLVNAAIGEGVDPGQRVADFVRQEQDIKCKLRIRDNDKNNLMSEYKRKSEEINVEIKYIQGNCPHIEKTYYGDPSGNNDDSTVCDWCGKEL